MNTLTSYIHHIQTPHAVDSLVVMEILHWKTPVRYHKNIPIDANNQKVNRVNSELKHICTGLSNILLWQHTQQLQHPPVICSDGVHLKMKDVKKYWQSVHGAALLAVRG